MDDYKLTNEEAVFARQLFEIRHELSKLRVEEDTHVDRLLTILRGHQVYQAASDEFMVKCFMGGISVQKMPTV